MLCAALLLVPAAAPRVARAQPQTPESAAVNEDGLPAELQALLEQVQDFSFDFDEPAFYALVAHLQRGPAGNDPPSVPLDRWATLLERPRDYRGRRIAVAGRVGRNSAYVLRSASAGGLGPVWQVELHRSDEPVACTVVFTQDASDLPIGAWIDVSGYFLKVRQYHSGSNRVRQAVLLVARAPSAIEQASRTAAFSASAALYWIAAGVLAALLVLWILLRQSAARPRHVVQTLRAQRAAPLHLADDLKDWAETDDATPERPPQR